jgi:preprotein translocase subunit YajC
MNMSLLIPDAYAAVPVAGHGGFSMNMILMLVIFGAFIYFFLWRPQAKRAKQHQQLVTSIKPGDEIVTAGGMMARITKVTDDYFQIQVGKESEILLQKNSIARVLPNGRIYC